MRIRSLSEWIIRIQELQVVILDWATKRGRKNDTKEQVMVEWNDKKD